METDKEKRYTAEGSNLKTASGILGAFWTRVFPDNGIVSSVMQESAWSETVAEGLIRSVPAWLSGKADGIMRMDRLEVVPVDRACSDIVHMDSGFIVGGAAVDAPSPSLKWRVKLSRDYTSVPLAIPFGGSPMICGVDYELEGRYLILRENPAALGIPSSVEDVDGQPALSWSLLLPACVPDGEGVHSNFDFYGLPPSVRESLMDMLTQEATLVRILRFLENCVGVKGPTIFEKNDENGAYTSLEATWIEEDTLYGVTSGGEIVSTPVGESLLSGYNKDDNRIGMDSPLTKGVRVYGKYSEGDGVGLASSDVLVPNSEQSVAAGKVGVIDPKGGWEDRFSDALENAGETPSTVLPASASANPVERLYDAAKRHQPLAACLDGRASGELAGMPGAFDAVKDSLPSGTILILSQNVGLDDSIRMGLDDSCEVFKAVDLTESATLGASDVTAVPKRTVL